VLDGVSLGFPEPVLAKEELSFFPNPVSGILTMKSGLFLPGMRWQITVFDSWGRDISETVGYSDNRDEIKLDLSSFPEGFYLARLQSENKFLTGKVIKQ